MPRWAFARTGAHDWRAREESGAQQPCSPQQHARISNPSHISSSPPFFSQVVAASYDNIALSLGVDSPGDVLFATDNPAEARAAAAAGWRAVLVERPGNAPLSKADRADFQCVESLEQLGF